MPMLDWKRIEQRFIKGSIDKSTGKHVDYSFAELATEYGCSRQTVCRHASRKDKDGLNWYEKRERYKAEIDAEVAARRREMDIESLVEIRKRNYAVSKTFVEQFERALKENKMAIRPSMALSFMMYMEKIGEMTHGVENKSSEDRWLEIIQKCGVEEL